MNFDASALQLLLQEIARRRVQLTLHQVAHQMQDHHLHAMQPERRRSLQSEQTAADHDSLGVLFLGCGHHRLDIVIVAKCHDARQVPPGNWDHEGSGSGRNH
jgi:hypothetical protein